jgi:hypothetical protein
LIAGSVEASIITLDARHAAYTIAGDPRVLLLLLLLLVLLCCPSK